MSKQRHLTIARLKEILRRQDPPKWGPDYEPAIRATREEAPPSSRPAMAWSTKFQRHCHVLSAGELTVLFIALNHPSLFELQEQRMLCTEPRPHPLVSHPLAIGMNLPELRGTVDVAQRLDFLRLHPRVFVTDPGSQAKLPVPFPWIGDFLLFLSDAGGPYCVNWTVKNTEDDFNHSFRKDRPVRDPKGDELEARARHAIEDIYYQDAGIRTVRITLRDVPKTLQINLRNLFTWHAREITVPDEVKAEIVERLRASIQTGQAPLEILLSIRQRHGHELHDLKAVFFQAVWNRLIRVDLINEPILVDRPLKPETTDIIVLFAHWFTRGEV
ncbi:MAG: hypothetical protein HHJ17_11570 [Rhodoferax sp.]|uniref:hypothetical protein n=1 Tax=Rhodoferax sp. TaxID=50421 RepID=UPI0017937E5B|nr:hypothetical protein [Rhodoferax sp.]NMM14160.1 hypothetical protein [Rhodoferax sp.]